LAGKYGTTDPLARRLVSALVLALVGAEPAVAWKAEAVVRKLRGSTELTEVRSRPVVPYQDYGCTIPMKLNFESLAIIPA
jgi:hypothetical protein